MFEPFVQDARSGLSRLLFFTFGRGWQPGARASNADLVNPLAGASLGAGSGMRRALAYWRPRRAVSYSELDQPA